MRGELSRGERLPNEAVLAREFGVSRGTVREALRVLAAQNLIRTAKGAGGGSFVTLPTVDHISSFPAKLGTEEHFVYNKEFHSAVLDGCGNTLLCIAAQPVFSVLQTNLARDAMSQRFAKRINEDHRAILAAIEDGDAEAAAEQMQRHLAYLSRTYQKMWRQSTGVDGVDGD